MRISSGEICFGAAMTYLPRGWALVREPGLKRFVVLPLLVNLIVFSALGYWLWSQFEHWSTAPGLLDGLESVPLIGGALQSMADWAPVRWLLAVLKYAVALGIVLVTVQAFSLLANLVGSPFNGLLAEQVEAHLLGQPVDTQIPWRRWLATLPRLLWAEIIKLWYLARWLVLLYLALLVPGLNLVAPWLLMAFGAWVLALEYVDYPMGNHGHTFVQVRECLRQNRPAALGFGTVVALASLVPVANLFVMPVAVAGATALYVEKLRS